MKVGIIGRFKPPHLGSANMLRTLCRQTDDVLIGIGSSNKYNARNPFVVGETKSMIKLILHNYDNYHIFPIPDFGNGKEWAEFVYKTFGDLDYIVSGNEYVIDLLKEYYRILHTLVIPNLYSCHRSTEVRISLARGGNWASRVPPVVADYMKRNGLDKRFVREFGKETLETASIDTWKDQSLNAEKEKTLLKSK